MDTRQDYQSCQQSTVAPCEAALGESGGRRQDGTFVERFVDTTSNDHHTAPNYSQNHNGLKDINRQFMYRIYETHGATVVAKKGRSEYICDRFSSSSVAAEAEFRAITSRPKIRVYIISPGNAQGTYNRFAQHSPYSSLHFVYVNHIILALIERMLPNSGSGVGPGGRGYPFLSMRFRRIFRIVSTITTVISIRTTGWVAELDHSISCGSLREWNRVLFISRGVVLCRPRIACRQVVRFVYRVSIV